jgi:phosphoenolpyruvate-protein kinase (PTS system EI component)
MISYTGISFGYGIACCRVVEYPPDLNAKEVLVFCAAMPSLGDLETISTNSNVCGVLLPPLSPISHHAWLLSYYAKPAISVDGPINSYLEMTVCADFDRQQVFIPENPAELLMLYTESRREAEARALNRVDHLPGRHNGKLRLLTQLHTSKDVAIALNEGADGVGEIKAELMLSDEYLANSHPKSLSAIYRQIRLLTEWKPIPIRFFDFTDDKRPAEILSLQTPNVLGYRGVRLLETSPQIVDQFLRLLEGLDPADLVVVLPMVSSATEVARFRRSLPTQSLKVGVQVETPAAALSMRELLGESDHFVIGLNDLTQYTTAWDRNIASDERTPCNSIQPAVARLISQVCVAAQEANAHVSLALDLYPSPQIVRQLFLLQVPALTVSPRVISRWNHYLGTDEGDIAAAPGQSKPMTARK